MSGFHFFTQDPSPRLAPFVERLWGVRGSADFHVESVLPDGAVQLMVNFGPTQAVVAYGDRECRDEFRRAWIAGIQDQRLVHASPQGADHISVQFRPGGAHAFFGLPMDELADQVVELDDLIGPRAADELGARLREAEGDEARCQVFQRWLLERRASVHPYFATVQTAMELLRRGSRGTPVAEVCRRLGLSNRHLIKQFREMVGLTPRTYGRIERFQKVIVACRGKDDVPWSRLAAECGYADQSHLIREFRRFAAVTPEEFLAVRTPEGLDVVVE